MSPPRTYKLRDVLTLLITKKINDLSAQESGKARKNPQTQRKQKMDSGRTHLQPIQRTLVHADRAGRSATAWNKRATSKIVPIHASLYHERGDTFDAPDQSESHSLRQTFL
jgi:hypothetical protein